MASRRGLVWYTDVEAGILELHAAVSTVARVVRLHCSRFPIPTDADCRVQVFEAGLVVVGGASSVPDRERAKCKFTNSVMVIIDHGAMRIVPGRAPRGRVWCCHRPPAVLVAWAYHGYHFPPQKNNLSGTLRTRQSNSRQRGRAMAAPTGGRSWRTVYRLGKSIWTYNYHGCLDLLLLYWDGISWGYVSDRIARAVILYLGPCGKVILGGQFRHCGYPQAGIQASCAIRRTSVVNLQLSTFGSSVEFKK